MVSSRYRMRDGAVERRAARPSVLVAVALAALPIFSGCALPEPRVAFASTSAVFLPSDAEPAACLRQAEASREQPAYPALVLGCAAASERTVAAEAEQAALEQIVRTAVLSRGQTSGPVALAPNVLVRTDELPDGTYLAAASGDGIIPGRGVPMLLVRPEDQTGPNRPPEGVMEPVAITASVERSGNSMTVRLRAQAGADLLRSGGADASGAAYLRLLERTRLRGEARDGFRRPEVDTFRRAGVYLIEPYDPGRIPILMIHGLRSSPEIWRTLTLKILTEPELHSRFQVWHAFYPTGLPPFFSASNVRQQLRDVLATYDPEGRDLPSRRMAVIGHSMGGIITRALVTDDAGLLWRASFRVPAEDLDVSPERLAVLLSTLSLKPEPQIGFAAFINTPHRGSRTATGVIGRLGSALIRLPLSFTSLFIIDEPFVAQITDAMRPYLVDDFADSVRTLELNHPLLLALSETRPAPGLRVTSVISVRGGAACLQNPNCTASDGVVPYSSAHLAFGSELLVAGGHDGYRDPAALAFLTGELLDWAGQVGQ